MEIYIYFIVFLIGSFFGSFYTLAVYRIPLHKDITHEHSFCPNCNHKLGVLDLIPVASYIFLGGKCRYCGQKIRIRYLLLEILSGIIFIILFNSLRINVFDIEVSKVICFAFCVLIYTALVINTGIVKEKKSFEKSVNIYGVCVLAGYILYLCIVESANIYRYSIYLVSIVFSLFIYVFLKYLYKRNNNKFFYYNIFNIILMLFSNYLIFWVIK